MSNIEINTNDDNENESNKGVGISQVQVQIVVGNPAGAPLSSTNHPTHMMAAGDSQSPPRQTETAEFQKQRQPSCSPKNLSASKLSKQNSTTRFQNQTKQASAAGCGADSSASKALFAPAVVCKQFSASSNKQSAPGEAKKQTAADNTAASNKSQAQKSGVAPLRRSTRDSKPSSRLQAAVESNNISLAVARQASVNSSSRRDSSGGTTTAGGNTTGSTATQQPQHFQNQTAAVVGPPNFNKNVPRSTEYQKASNRLSTGGAAATSTNTKEKHSSSTAMTTQKQTSVTKRTAGGGETKIMANTADQGPADPVEESKVGKLRSLAKGTSKPQQVQAFLKVEDGQNQPQQYTHDEIVEDYDGQEDAAVIEIIGEENEDGEEMAIDVGENQEAEDAEPVDGPGGLDELGEEAEMQDEAEDLENDEEDELFEGDEDDDDDEDEDDDEDDDDDDDESIHDSKAASKRNKKSTSVGAGGHGGGRVKRRNKKQTSRKLWSKSEDDAIVELVKEHGTRKWTFVANKLEEKFKIRTRTGKQCRERWHNHLDPYINKTPINKIEEKRIFDLHKKLGNKWADIAKDLPGRSDNCIKNYFYSTHRKHQRRINKCLRNAQVAKVLGHSKHTTAEELYKLVLMKKTTYEEIRRIDPCKFMDLEATMRMLYDHGDMTFEDSSSLSTSLMPPATQTPTPLNSISPTNASMREPKGSSNQGAGRGTSTRANAASAKEERASLKRKTRPESLIVKPPKSEKVPKRASNQTGASGASKKQTASTPAETTTRKTTEKQKTQQLQSTISQVTESAEDPYQRQQSTPVFVEKQDLIMTEVVASQQIEHQPPPHIKVTTTTTKQTKKRGKKAQAKEQAAAAQAAQAAQAAAAVAAAAAEIEDSTSKDFALQTSFNLSNLTVTKQESSSKEKGFHQLPYTTQQPGQLNLGRQPSGCSYKNLNLNFLNRAAPIMQPGSTIAYNQLGYMHRGYPIPQFHPLQGYGIGGIDPACLAKYEPAWGADFDRITKGQPPAFKSGELPPATPDPSQMFKQENFFGQNRQFRQLHMPQNDGRFNLSMNSPMFIPFLNEISPRPPPTRTQQYNQQSNQQPGALNVTFNVNLSSNDFRPPTTNTTIPTPQPTNKVACQQCGMVQCSCADLSKLDLKDISKLFQIDGQKSAMAQTINLQHQHQQNTAASQHYQASQRQLNNSQVKSSTTTTNYRPQLQTSSFAMLQSDAQGNNPTQQQRRLESGSDLKSELKPGSSSNDTKNNNLNNPMKDSNSFMQLSSLNNSEMKLHGQTQSFMNRMNSALPLVKDVSFGGPQSLGVISGMPSTSTAKREQVLNCGGGKQQENGTSVFPTTMQSQIVFSTLMGRTGSVTPRPFVDAAANVTHQVTVDRQSIRTPKYVPPIAGAMMNAVNYNQDPAPLFNVTVTQAEADVTSIKSGRSQRSAFKPVAHVLQRQRSSNVTSENAKLAANSVGDNQNNNGNSLGVTKIINNSVTVEKQNANDCQESKVVEN